MLGPGRAQSHYVRGLDGPRGPFCTDASVPTAVTEGIGLSVTAVFMPPLYRAGRLVATSNEPPEVRDHESLSALSLHPRLPADDALHDARHAWAPLGVVRAVPMHAAHHEEHHQRADEDEEIRQKGSHSHAPPEASCWSRRAYPPDMKEA